MNYYFLSVLFISEQRIVVVIFVILHYTLYNGAEIYAAASPNPETGASPELDTPATAFGQVDRNVG